MTDRDISKLERRIRTALKQEAAQIDPPTVAVDPVEATENFDSFYATRRGRLYRALVVALRDRDLATEAVDIGMSRSFQRWRKIKGQGAEAAAYAAAYKWAAKRTGRTDGPRGFRLQRTDRSPESAATEAAFASLPLADRSLLASHRILGWDEAALGAAHGIAPETVARRISGAIDKLAATLDVDTETADHRVTGAIRTEARDLVEPLGRPETVRGRAWLQRSGVALGSAAAVLVLVGGVGWLMNSAGGDDPVAAANTSSGSAITAGSSAGDGLVAAATAGELEWSQIPLPISEGDISSIISGPAGFVAFGQEWSGPGQSIALLSEDGFTWEPLSLPLPQQAWVNTGNGSQDGYVVAVQAFDEFAGRESTLILSSDDGVDWITSALPEAPDSVAGLRVHTWTSVNSIIQNDDGSVEVTAFRGGDIENLDVLLRDVMPEGVNMNEWGWGTSPNGVDVYGENGIVTTVGWDELGLDQEVIDLISGNLIQWKADELGGEWAETPLARPALGQQSWISASAGVEDGAVAVVGGAGGGGSLWHRGSDGEWSRVTGIDATTSINAVARFGDQVIAGGSKNGRPMIFTSSDGVSWSEQILEGFTGGAVERLVVAPGGVAAVVNSANFTATSAELVVGDLTVTIGGSGIYTVTDADGEEIIQVFAEDTIIDESGVSIIDPDTGDTIVTFTQVEMNQAWEEVWRGIEFEGGFEGPTYDVAVSTDATTWSPVGLQEATGGGFYPQNVVADRGVVIISGFQEEGGRFGGFDRGPSPVLWVGSLPE